MGELGRWEWGGEVVRWGGSIVRWEGEVVKMEEGKVGS